MGVPEWRQDGCRSGLRAHARQREERDRRYIEEDNKREKEGRSISKVKKVKGKTALKKESEEIVVSKNYNFESEE